MFPVWYSHSSEMGQSLSAGTVFCRLSIVRIDAPVEVSVLKPHAPPRPSLPSSIGIVSAAS